MNENNAAQVDYWNGRAGEKWATMQVALDQMLAPLTIELKRRAGTVAGKRVLDIGCGTGETCAIWQQDGAHVTGLDVSAPMLAVAAERTHKKATLVQADAASWKSDEPFDLAVSRFGLMFFTDVDAAFSCIATNVRPGGRLLFACWRAMQENEWVAKPMSILRDLLPEEARHESDQTDASAVAAYAPGPFALADQQRLMEVLARAGFRDASIKPFAFPVYLAAEGGTAAAARFLMQIGPTAAALAKASKPDRAAATERLADALVAREQDGCVTLGGAAWLVEAVRASTG